MTSSSLNSNHMIAEWCVDPQPLRKTLDEISKSEKEGILIPDLVCIVIEYLKSVNNNLFGEREWKRLVGRVNPAPAFPSNIEAILQEDCLIFPGKKIKETHLLIYMPTEVNGLPLTLKSLGEFAKKYFPENNAGYKNLWDPIAKELGDTPLAKSSWTLMTKDVLPESLNKCYGIQRDLVARLTPITGAFYEIPKILEAAICILTHNFNTQERLFNDSPCTIIRCQENVQGYKTGVGAFSTMGLVVNHILGDCSPSCGIAPLRKFF